MGWVEVVGRIYSNFFLVLIVNQMEFDKTRWSCLWNSDQNCTQNSVKGWYGQGGGWVEEGWWGQGMEVGI